VSEFDEYEGVAPDDATVSPEVDEADAYEQLRGVDDTVPDLVDVPEGVDPADAAEQNREVGGDEDEYDER
jgi:hypothetical protein